MRTVRTAVCVATSLVFLAAGVAAAAERSPGAKRLAAAAVNRPPAETQVAPHAPKADAFDLFDSDQSPLEKGLLDARDVKWRKNIKLGSDPRCSRVLREVAHGKPRIKLCSDHDWSTETCVRQYCCTQPEVQNGQVVCTGADDAAILECADALIQGQDTSACVGSAPLTFEQTRTQQCLDQIFKDRGNHPADCLEDPDRDDDGEVDPRCRAIFEACDNMPVATARRTHVSATGKAKRLHTHTEIFYERPSKMKTPPPSGDEAWDPLQMRGAITKDETLGVPGGPRPVDRVHSAGSFNPLGTANCDPLYRCPENDDGDCIDRVTGEHLTDCFDDAGRLRGTLEWVSDPADLRCRHTATGEVLEGASECLNEDGTLATTLEQQIDEDGPDVSNLDGDCKLAGTTNDGLRSDCLGSDGRLLPDYEWNVAEDPCDGVNNDGDCLAITPDGTGEGRIGLLRTSDDACVLADHRVFHRPDFKELVDEDCPTAVDNDGDGLVDEDPPGVAGTPRWAMTRLVGVAAPTDDPALLEDQARCVALYQRYGLKPEADEIPNSDHGCNLDRLMRVHVNRELVRSNQQKRFQALTTMERFFDVDDEGRWCVDGAPNPQPGCRTGDPRGVVNGTQAHDPQHGRYRFEERRATVDEVFAVKCKPVKTDTDGDGRADTWVDTEYDSATGTCVLDDQAAAAQLAASWATDPSCLVSNPAPECRQAMMGFTFAPPVIEWGWRVQWRVCVFGFCFEIFYARIGYEFDLATGIRLPVEIDFDDVPQSALATDAHAFDATTTTLTPKDFTVEEFKKFCELHRLDAPWYIADCDRFSFPDFLDDRDGDEFVAHYAVFAGLIVRVLSIPILNWGIDSAVDIPAMCTIFKMKDGIEGLSFQDMIKIQLGLLEDGDPLGALKDSLGNCGSFTTPFGMEACPECTTGWRLRGWPFLSLEKHIRADCVSALIHGEVMTIKGQTRPICTGMVLGYQGASLGIGLIIEATAGSRLITADQTAAGDGRMAGAAEIEYTKSSNEPDSAVPLEPVTVDNYAGTNGAAWDDEARVGLGGFTYYLNAIEVALSANLEFGGILEPIPDIGSFVLYNLVFDTGRFGIPIPQHPGTAPVTIAVPVENYGLTVDVRAPDGSPDRVDDKTLAVRPGEFGAYTVLVTNEGSVDGSFGNFACELSNRPYLSGVPPGELLTFTIDPNTDHDCTGLDHTGHWFGDPYDGVADDCYDAAGVKRADRIELIDEDPPGPDGPPEVRDEDHDGLPDEDPPDVWLVDPVGLPNVSIGPVAAHQPAVPLTVSASPFRHPLTKPGVYALRVTADSTEAGTLGLPETDPLGIYRRQSVSLRGNPETWQGPAENPHVAFLLVEAFYDPQVVFVPPLAAANPGESTEYRIAGTNGSNDADVLMLSTALEDSNVAGCDLADRGRVDRDCPYRAALTAIPESWIVGTLPTQFGSAESPLAPLEGGSSTFEILVPADWAGMGDVVYSVAETAMSSKDPAVPRASRTVRAQHTVHATPESQARYLGLEIAALIAEIEQANAQGVGTSGLHPIATHPIQMSNQAALDAILAGDVEGGIRKHRTTVQTTKAFLHVLDATAPRIPEEYAADWKRRADAILADLNVATGAGSALGESDFETASPAPRRIRPR